MTDQNKKRYRKAYAAEFELASAIAKYHGFTTEWSEHDYEVFTIKGNGMSLIAYPHRTGGTGNYNIRVRDNGSKYNGWSIKPEDLMKILDYASGNDNTFSRKHGCCLRAAP